MADPSLDLFLNLLFEWTPDGETRFKVVTAISPVGADGKRPVRNNGARTYFELAEMIDKRRRWPRTDIYIALAEFENASDKTSKDGFPWVDRDKKNAVSLKSLFMDIDVGPGKAYATPADADAALAKFLVDSGMPQPTMVVRSGSGGLHVYWCFEKPVPVMAWQPLATALKASAKHHKFEIDPAVTADAARILRVPTTLNYKQPIATMVTLDHPGAIRLYTVDAITKVLAPFATVVPPGAQQGPAPTSPWAQNFTANATAQMPKLPIDQIATVCPAIADTLAVGGAGKSEPEWANDIFTAAWTLDPVDAAHRLSKGHAQYSVAGTDRKLAEKQQALASNPSLGWPQCVSFNHPKCKTCVLLQLGKSPINFAHKPQAQSFHAVNPNDPLMPEGYWRNANNHVFTHTQYGPADVFGYPILDGGMDPATNELVIKNFVMGRERWGSISTSKQNPQGMAEALTKGAHMFLRQDLWKTARDFIMAWVTHLQTTKREVAPVSFGWHGDEFVYGDESFTPTGAKAIYQGSQIDPHHKRVGSDQPWRDAMKLIYGNGPLEMLVATAFAAPLVQMAIDGSLVVSIYSPHSGYGKSTAMKLAQSVWGNPRTGMSMLDDTRNALTQKISALKNLPVYWDELKTKDQVDDMVKLVFATTQGRGKARLSRDSTQMPIGMSTTMFAVASNLGILNHVIHHTQGSDAGGLRVFEVQAGPLITTQPSSYGEQLLIPLNENYGVIGSAYVDFIVRNKATVRQVIKTVNDDLQTVCSFKGPERFWQATMATILAGAYLANAAGLATFDTALITLCLVETFRRLRSSKAAKLYDMTSADAGEDFLAELLNDLRGHSMITTKIVPIPAGGGGRPIPVTTLDAADPMRMKDVWLQYGEDDGRILIRVKMFNEWHFKRNRNADQSLEVLRKDYIVHFRRGSIGVGVSWLSPVRTECYDLTPKVPPAPPPSRNPSSPSSNFGSP